MNIELPKDAEGREIPLKSVPRKWTENHAPNARKRLEKVDE